MITFCFNFCSTFNKFSFFKIFFLTSLPPWVNNTYNDMMVKSSVRVGQFFELVKEPPVSVFLNLEIKEPRILGL